MSGSISSGYLFVSVCSCHALLTGYWSYVRGFGKSGMKYNLAETTKSKTPLNAGYCFLFGYMHNVDSASFHGGFCEYRNERELVLVTGFASR